MTLAPSLSDRRTSSAERRRARYDLRRVIREAGDEAAAAAGSWSSVAWRRTCSCGLAMGDDVQVAWSTSADAAYPVNLSTCGSVWACPVCSAKVRSRRTSEVEALASWHAAQGGELVMVTLTVAHESTDSLAKLVAGLSEAFRVVQRSRAWKSLRMATVGQTRSLEVTQGFGSATSNGWHPHLHLLLLARPGMAELVQADALDLLCERWPSAVVKELGEAHRPSLSAGIDVRCIGTSSAAYVTKIAQEVTLSDLKAGARSVWALPVAGEWSRWGEYCAAMKGRRAVQWSRGLRDLAGIGPELSDEELCALNLEDGLIVEVVHPKLWNRYERHGRACEVLESVESRARAVRSSSGPPARLAG